MPQFSVSCSSPGQDGPWFVEGNVSPCLELMRRDCSSRTDRKRLIIFSPAWEISPKTCPGISMKEPPLGAEKFHIPCPGIAPWPGLEFEKFHNPCPGIGPWPGLGAEKFHEPCPGFGAEKFHEPCPAPGYCPG